MKADNARLLPSPPAAQASAVPTFEKPHIVTILLFSKFITFILLVQLCSNDIFFSVKEDRL